MKYKIGIFIVGASMVFHQAQGQIKFKLDIMGGGNYTWVRNHVLQGERPAFGWHFGPGLTVMPSAWKKVSFGLNTIFSQKGYNQWAGKTYEFKFQYLSFQDIANYRISKFISMQAGIDISVLVDTNMEEGLSTYKNTDVGLVAGLRLFEDKVLMINMQLVYGLTPMLNYSDIDALGNFTGKIKDLKNTCISLGIRYRIIE